MGSRRVKYDIGSILCRGSESKRKVQPRAGVYKVGIMVEEHSEVSERKKNYAIRAVFQCKKSRKIKYRKISKGGKIISICRLHEIFT